MPRVTVVTQQVTVVLTPTPLPPEPTPPYQDPQRRDAVLDGLGKAVALPGATPTTAVAIVDADVLAVVDDGDPEAWSSLPDSAVTPTPGVTPAELVVTPTPGLFGGMRYFDLSKVDLAKAKPEELPVFNWPPVAIAEPGTYRLFAHVPSQHGTVVVGYSAKLIGADGVEADVKIGQQDVVAVDQSTLSDQWIVLGDVQLDRAGSLRVSARPSKPGTNIGNLPAEAAFDTLAIVRVNQASPSTQ